MVILIDQGQYLKVAEEEGGGEHLKKKIVHPHINIFDGLCSLLALNYLTIIVT